MVNPRHQALRGQPAANPEAPFLEYPSWQYNFDIKVADGNMFNPIF